MPTPGLDRANSTETDSPKYFGYREAFAAFRSVMSGSHGYQLRSEGTPGLCGFEVYERTYNLLGLKTPKGWHKWSKVTTDRKAATAFLKTAREVLLELMAPYSKEDPEYRAYLQVLSDLDNPYDPRTKAQTVARFELNTYEPPSKSLYGSSGCYKVLPGKEWFPAEIQAIDPYSLLSLFPEAERQLMMLFLGRIVIGATGEASLEGIVEHPFRHFGIVVGRGDAGSGTGKTTFFNWLIDCLGVLGYSVSVLDNNLGRFSWAERALSDFLYCDDLTKRLQSSIISSDKIKTLVSNGLMFTEEKGLTGVQVKSRTVFMACSNSTNPADLIDVDPGVRKRLCQLDTKTTKELCTPEQDYRTKQYWEALGHNPLVLMAWLLRNAADTFLEASGYQYSPVAKVLEHQGPQELEPRIEDLREKLAISTSLGHVEEMVRACLHLKAMAIAYWESRSDKRGRTCRAIEIGGHLIASVLTIWVQSKGKVPEGFETLLLPMLSKECLGYLKPKVGLFKDLKMAKTHQGVMDTILSELKSTQGFGYPKSTALWVGMFEAEERDLPGLIAHYEPIISQAYEEEDYLSEILDNIDKMVSW